MPAENVIRADFNRDSIVVYQAFAPTIADAALAAGRFIAPFSFERMTWIKPSFLWLMYRSQWGQKSRQQRVLAVRIQRAGWEQALAQAVPTSFVPGRFASRDQWASEFAAARVHVQWDTERSLRGAPLPCFSIQVGLSRHVIRQYVDDWIISIEDYTPRVRKIRSLLLAGQATKAMRHLPPEQVYPLGGEIARRVAMV